MSRKVLITGASRGLGLALVEHFLAAGDSVVGCSRSESELERERYHHVSADVTDDEDVNSLFRAVRKHLGGLDILVNNAGTAKMSPMALTPTSVARHVMDINFLGTFRMSSQAVRMLRKSSSGRIVNLTTVAVPLRLEGEAVYAASKAAVESFTRITARELGPMGITCNAIGPSPILTDLIRGVPQDKLDALIKMQAINEWAKPEDVVNAVDFFVRPESRMITGQIIYLGGVG